MTLVSAMVFASACSTPEQAEEPDASPPTELPRSEQELPVAPVPVPGMRARLIEHVWGEGGFPASTTPDVEADTDDPWIPNIAGAASVDRLTISAGFQDPLVDRFIANHYHPATGGNNRLIVYHGGHCTPHCSTGPRAIEYFLERGFSVLAYWMPLYGPNLDPDWDWPPGRHDYFIGFEDEGGGAMKAFFHQLAIGINYVKAQFDYDDISMTGYSGGGWTSTLYPALDPRIDNSFPIAGTMPRSFLDPATGDFEQKIVNRMYNIATYLDFYYLAATGAGRRHIQMLNLNDPCCFAAAGLEDEIAEYETGVQQRLGTRGGSFSVYVVQDHNGHEIAFEALAFIHSVLTGNVSITP